MRVVFLTHYFPPEAGAAPARIAALARGLAGARIDVTVHTGFPHYPDGGVKPPYRNRPWQREGLAGAAGGAPVSVLRSAVYPAANRGFARRLADHAAFAAGALATASLAGPADVVVVETPPLFTAAAGVAYARAKRAALVVNVADRWPATAVELGALSDARAIAAAEWLERWCYRHAAAITTPTAGIAAALEELPDARGKVRRMLPAVDLDRFDPRPPAPSHGPLRVLYAGNLGLAQGIGTLVEAARIAGPDVVEVTIAGDGPESDEIAALSAAVANVAFLGRVDHDAVPGLYARSDAGAVLLRAQPILEGAFPTKLLEVMAAGRAVILAARGEAAEEVRDAGAGLVAAPDDAPALADALRRAAADRDAVARWGAAGRARAEARYGRERSLAEWRALLARVAA